MSESIFADGPRQDGDPPACQAGEPVESVESGLPGPAPDPGRDGEAPSTTPAPVLPPTPVPPDDPFDLTRAAVAQDFGAAAVRRVITDVTVGKPNREWYVRVRPETEHRHQVYLMRLKEGDKARGFYWIRPDLREGLMALPAVTRLIRGYHLFTGINRAGRPFLWPVPLPEPDGSMNDWHKSELEAAIRAMTAWVRIEADMGTGGNAVYEAEAPLPAPLWPDLTLQDLVRLGFKQRIIDAPDHLVIRQLRGLE